MIQKLTTWLKSTLSSKKTEIEDQFEINDDFYEKLSLLWLKVRLSKKVKINTLSNLASRIDNGSTIIQELKNLTTVYERHQPKSSRTKFIRILYERYNTKPDLIYMITPFFPSNILTIISAGEKNKNAISDNIRLASEILKKQQALKLATQIGYLAPVLVSMLILGVLYVCHAYVFKEILQSLPKESIPQSFKDNVVIIGHIIDYSWLFILCVIGFVIYAVWSVSNQVKYRPKSMPPWNIADSTNCAIFLKSFSTLYEAGVPIPKIIDIINDHSDKYVSHWCRHIYQKTINGYSEGQALACGFFNTEARMEIESYSGSEDFTSQLNQISENVYEINTKKVNGLVTGIVLLCMLIMIGTGVYIAATVNGVVSSSI